MTRISEVGLQAFPIDRYATIANHGTVEELRALAVRASDCLVGRAMWHINSTAAGGGVAEMLPSMLGYCRDLGIDARWLVINGEPDFFQITKRLTHQPSDNTLRIIGRECRSALGNKQLHIKHNLSPSVLSQQKLLNMIRSRLIKSQSSLADGKR